MTQNQYEQKLLVLETLDPESKLLPMLRKGFSQLNAIYLNQALKNVKKVPVFIEEKEVEVPDDNLQIRVRKLYGERAKLSNRFHELDSDKARAENSKEIQRIQRQIQDLLTNGQTEADNEIPEDPIAMMKFLNSTRAKISQAKKELERLGALPDDDPGRSNIPNIEARLQKLNLTKEHVVRIVEQKETIHGS
jgi:hypothetical protein